MIEKKMYSIICRNDGIKAKEIARQIGVERGDINRLLYNAPFVRELCYRDSDYRWHGLIRQARPHNGLGYFCGYYATVDRFLRQPEDEWLEELKEGCRSIGRNLNDTRGLIHSFLDSRAVMISLFADLADLDTMDTSSWEICFELRIKRSRSIRIYADVLVITPGKVFSLEFKMKDRIEPEEVLQAAKYVPYLEILFGRDMDIYPALVLTSAAELFTWEAIGNTEFVLPVCSGDMLFNVFNEGIGFLQ